LIHFEKGFVPEDMEVIITDTVGFIRNLPDELLRPFESTLKTVRGDVLLHVIDVANPVWRNRLKWWKNS
jgi:GTP-binding protein HflX